MIPLVCKMIPVKVLGNLSSISGSGARELGIFFLFCANLLSSMFYNLICTGRLRLVIRFIRSLLTLYDSVICIFQEVSSCKMEKKKCSLKVTVTEIVKHTEQLDETEKALHWEIEMFA